MKESGEYRSPLTEPPLVYVKDALKDGGESPPDAGFDELHSADVRIPDPKDFTDNETQKRHPVSDIARIAMTFRAEPAVQKAIRAFRTNPTTEHRAGDALHAYTREAGCYRELKPHEEQSLFADIADGLKAYKESNQLRSVTPAQEALLIKAAEAHEIILHTHLRLVVHVAGRYWFTEGMEPLDLIQEGNFGLQEAIGFFDASRGVPFNAYATYWIRGKMWRAIVEDSRLVRLPPNAHSQYITLRRREGELAIELGRQPTNAELEAETELSHAEFCMLMNAGLGCVFLNAPVQNDRGEEDELGSIISDGASDMDQVTDRLSDQRQVMALLGFSTLSDLEKVIIGLHKDLAPSLLGNLAICLEGEQVPYKELTERMQASNEPDFDAIGGILGWDPDAVRSVNTYALKSLRVSSSRWKSRRNAPAEGASSPLSG